MSLRPILGAALLLTVSLLGCTASPKTSTTSCTNGLKSDGNGHCVECVATADCPAGTFCGGNVCASCSTSPESCSSGDGGTSNGSCAKDSDCSSDKVCDKATFTCVAGCSATSCGTGKYCDSATHQCAMGCGADTQCSGLTCCVSTHTCVDTQSNPAANCGSCGAPACATGNLCCNGACIDVNTDATNCGSCGNDCGGAGCVGGMCQTGYGLFGLFDLTGKVAGSSDNVEILKPFVYTRAGALDYQALLQRPCFTAHFDATHPQTLELDAGDVLMSGFHGGTFINTLTAPTDIACQFLNGDYACGYGMIMNNMLGAAPGESPFAASSGAPTTSALGTTAITIAAPGGASFGSFSLTATPGAGLGVMEDLSTVTYSATADTVLNLACPSGGCGFGGFLVFVQASSNDVAHFDEPATAGGSLACLGGYGGIGGFSLGDPIVTIGQADIATMLGGDSSIKTFETMVIQLGQNDLTNIANGRGMDSQGHQAVALARSGAFGVSTTAVVTTAAAH
jgi:hypothetical protein